jgi:hypothetical protein
MEVTVDGGVAGGLGRTGGEDNVVFGLDRWDVGTKQTDVGLDWQSGESTKGLFRGREAPPPHSGQAGGIWAQRHLRSRAACMRERVREFPQVSHRRHVCCVEDACQQQNTTCRCSSGS